MLPTKIVVLGAGGIIGQHMMTTVPAAVDARFVRKTPSALCDSVDLENWPAALEYLNAFRPDVIVNLAGESRPDVVERSPGQYSGINVDLPLALKAWALENGSHLIHVSSQAVYGHQGEADAPVNAYGRQKLQADYLLLGVPRTESVGIVRPTFVLGIRPFPGIGRENPAEAILRGGQTTQVNDRWFAVAFAWDVAGALWAAALERLTGLRLVGCPVRVTRFEIARALMPNLPLNAITHRQLEGAGYAPRPNDTSGPYTQAHSETFYDLGIAACIGSAVLQAKDGRERRPEELAAFFRQHVNTVLEKLGRGFGPLHNAVSEDFRLAGSPETPEELLAWYRSTEAYIWELTAYHLDAGFNYSGMCRGIVDALVAKDVKNVLCLGDGVGTLSLRADNAGLLTTYHDLAGSQTARFARFRFAARGAAIAQCLSTDFAPPQAEGCRFDAIVSLDFLEHVPNVEQWVRFVYEHLAAGGYFVAQNAFAIGSGPAGDMPMHLAENDRFERDWDPLLTAVGFKQLAPQWYQKPSITLELGL